LQVDKETDRPADPPVVKSVEVLWNPFDDIVPRTTPQERQAQEQFK
jgi:peptidyl-prolyl cis-trans isomerase SDCCAG10